MVFTQLRDKKFKSFADFLICLFVAGRGLEACSCKGEANEDAEPEYCEEGVHLRGTYSEQLYKEIKRSSHAPSNEGCQSKTGLG